MTDLTARLRDWREWFAPDTYGTRIITEAADEIERLDAAIKWWKREEAMWIESEAASAKRTAELEAQLAHAKNLDSLQTKLIGLLERQRDKALALHVMEQDTYMDLDGPQLVTYCGYCGWEPTSDKPHLGVTLLTPGTEASDE